MSSGSPESSLGTPSESVLGFRHLEDVDDLRAGLDTDLKPLDDESREIVGKNAQLIISHARSNGLSKVLLISSPRKRTLETSLHIQKQIALMDKDLRVRVRRDEHFAELEHGNLILPKNYEPGKRIEQLGLAWRVFWEQTFTEEAEYKNPNYHFGTPTGFDEKIDTQLSSLFSKPGESYRELALRYYRGILEYLENRERIKSSGFDVALIAHSATLSILRELVEIGIEYSRGELEIQTGDLMKLCWKRYISHLDGGYTDPGFGIVETLELSDIDLSVKNVLRSEIVYMTDPRNYEQ